MSFKNASVKGAKKKVGYMKCEYNDCGWCYAPSSAATNDEQGKCVNPATCPCKQIKELLEKAHNSQDITK